MKSRLTLAQEVFNSTRINGHEGHGDKVTSKTEWVTPETAAQWLEQFNGHNIAIKESKARRFAADMTAGRWEFNGESIIFAEDGHLSDGQHRLWAIVLSGKAQWFVVVRGVTRHSQVTVDQGEARAAPGQLGLVGIELGKSGAAAIRVYVRWHSGRFFGDQVSAPQKVTTSEIIRWAESHGNEVHTIRSMEPLVQRVLAPASIVLAVALTFAEIDYDDTTDFIGRLASGVGLDEGSPVLALRNRLLKIRTEQLKISDRDLVALFVTTWNAEREGRPLSKLQRPKGGTYTRATFPVAR